MADYAFPTKGPQERWVLDESRQAELKLLFPGTNLGLELALMLAWLEKNGPKTARGMNLFVLNWLRRAKNEPGKAVWVNHDALPPDPAPKPLLDASSERRLEIWKQFRAEGMGEQEAKTASYEAWRKEMGK